MIGLNPQQQQKLDNAIAKAKEVMSNNSSPLEALKQAGVNTDFIVKIANSLDNPIAKTVLDVTGLDKNEVSGTLHQLTNANDNRVPNAPSEVDSDVEKYKRALTRL